ncbi:MAG: SDR family oxidoreductase [Gemmatimonadetes bacterium]|nr:SDR family oxidoreductase [Gemmatimonadota bacterium]
MIDLSGKVALITGGSRGIGAAAARLFARAGARVGITYRTRRADADAVVRDIAEAAKEKGRGKRRRPERSEGEAGRVCIAIQADLTERSANERIVEETTRAFGRLDYFVANAGIWPAEPIALAEMPEDHWRRTVATNLDSVFYGCRAAIPALADGGSIVIISSTAGQRGEGFHADYAATKGGVISMVKSLAVELGPRLTVNCVAPGWVDTEMAAPALESGDRSEILEAIPLRRVAAAEDIAGPIVFLCSALARHITGEILNVNGGSVLCG